MIRLLDMDHGAYTGIFLEFLPLQNSGNYTNSANNTNKLATNCFYKFLERWDVSLATNHFIFGADPLIFNVIFIIAGSGSCKNFVFMITVFRRWAAVVEVSTLTNALVHLYRFLNHTHVWNCYIKFLLLLVIHYLIAF